MIGWAVAAAAAAVAAALGARLRAKGKDLDRLREAAGEREAALLRERDLLAEGVEAMPEGFLLLDARQTVTRANPGAERLLESGAAAGKALWEVSRDEGLLRAVAEVDGIPRMARLKVGAERHLTVSVAALKGGGRVLLAQDATESVRYQELRKEFVANVSHVVRTPLAVIRGYVETLREGAGEDPAKDREFLEIIERHAGQLSNLVENLLDLSRLESPQGMARKRPVDLGSLVTRVAELHRAPAERKGQRLEAKVEGALPAVSGDPDYLERAVANLVDNALKYTPEKGTIRVAARRSGERVLVEVADDGIGIPAADLPRIWERFYRVDKSRSRSMGGTGLGLAIVKHIAQAHGGSVDVTSAPGRGSTFRLLLPAA
jgi:signal transduction histidine kinase